MKRLLPLLILVSITNTCIAQNKFYQVGFQAGPSFINLYGNPFIETFLERDLSFAAGPAIYYPFSKRFAVKSNLFFEIKGSGGVMPLFDDAGEPLGFFNTKIRYNYLTVPLLFDYYFGRRLRGNLTMGPYVGVLLSTKSTFTEAVSGESIVITGTSNYIPWDGGLVLGAGGRYALNKRITLSLEGRFNIGMANIISRPILGSLTIYNISSQILLGVYYTPGYQAGKVRNTNL